MSYFKIKRRDTSPAILATLTDANGTPVNLLGATVRFHMRPVNTETATVDAAAVIVNPSAGTVRYDWQTSDTAVAGLHEAEWEATYSDNTVETFPNSGTQLIRIDPDIA